MFSSIPLRYRVFISGLLFIQQAPAVADGTVIDKIYHPYVQPLERELEFRSVIENNNGQPAGDRRLLRLGYGQSLNDKWFGEVYLIGTDNDGQDFRLNRYEVEALWQLTEQGEYSADWGLLFEIEKAHSEDIAEFTTALLVEKEWGRWTGTANLYTTYEFGDDIKSEFETALAMQARYRYAMHLEPAVELYKGQDTLGFGPVILGSHPLGTGRRLRWEAGIIFGLDQPTPDQSFKALLEYEF